MSRGHGTVQRAILAYLATDPSGPLGDTSLWRVTCAVFGVTSPTDAQRASVRRAANTLHATGLIQMTERESEGIWSKDDQNARFYTRRRRQPEGPPTEQVSVAERYVGRLIAPEEDPRYRPQPKVTKRPEQRSQPVTVAPPEPAPVASHGAGLGVDLFAG